MKVIQSGLRAWLIQRLSAVHMLLFALYALASWTLDRPGSYGAWRAWILSGSMRVATLPRLMMVDEMSLGLAPVIVDLLLETMTQIRSQGVTVAAVEQDVRAFLR